MMMKRSPPYFARVVTFWIVLPKRTPRMLSVQVVMMARAAM